MSYNMNLQFQMQAVPIPAVPKQPNTMLSLYTCEQARKHSSMMPATAKIESTRAEGLRCMQSRPAETTKARAQ